MKKIVLAAVLSVGFVVSGVAQTGGAAAQQPGSANVPSQGGALRVNSPRANEQLSQTFVHVQYQLVNRGVAAAPSPNFTIQLDGTDPVTTSAYDYTFTGLTPGAHTVTVTLVDANGVPIANSSVDVKFMVANGVAQTGLFRRETNLQLATSDVGTPLPMLSMVGFLVLVGGIVTTIRKRC